MICDTGLLASCETTNVLDSRSRDADNERVQSKTVDQAIKHRSGAREPSTSSHVAFQPSQNTIF
jgi:hypothetical protein